MCVVNSALIVQRNPRKLMQYAEKRIVLSPWQKRSICEGAGKDQKTFTVKEKRSALRWQLSGCCQSSVVWLRAVAMRNTYSALKRKSQASQEEVITYRKYRMQRNRWDRSRSSRLWSNHIRAGLFKPTRHHMLVRGTQFRTARDALTLFEWWSSLPKPYKKVGVGKGEQIGEPDEEVSLPRGIMSEVPESLSLIEIRQYTHQRR